MKITVPKVKEKMIAVSLFLVLWATKFLPNKMSKLLVSQNSITLLRNHWSRPYKLDAKRVSPNIMPVRIKKKTSRMSLKLLDISARGRA
jgi:hypothetical protein